jgi:PAS domain-containing protein
MRQAEQSFRDLYDNVSEGVFRSTLDGRMISANPSLVRLNGYDRAAAPLMRAPPRPCCRSAAMSRVLLEG